MLINAAKQAGVRRFVHVSITNPSENSPLPYFRGKWQVERAIIESGLSYAILRPTVASGPEDILVNNIAWLLRKFPLFAIPGSGEYRLQPIFVGDLAELAVQGGDSDLNFVRDAVGPETFTFNDLVRRVAQTVGSRAALVHTPPRLAWMLCKVIGLMTGDVTLTEDEVQGLIYGLLVSKAAPTGPTSLSEWMNQNAAHLGEKYASELARHYRHDSEKKRGAGVPARG